MNFFPLTSLPRTGSTLLLYILDQNPILKIGPDSEISNLLHHNKNFIESNIFHFQLPHEKVTDCFKSFCRSGVESWIEQISNSNEIFVDKSRDWLKNLDFIFNLFPEIRIIITIRDLCGILNSFEKCHNNSLFFDKQNFYENHQIDINFDLQHQRVGSILNLPYVKEGLISLKEIIDFPKKFKNQIMICRYEDLISNPKQELDKIYNFLSLPAFEHNFENIIQGNYYDNPYQPYGNHKIKNKIEYKEEIFSELRDDIKEKIINEFNWYYQAFYPEVIS